MKVADRVLAPAQRWTIVGLLSASITINLLDRQILSVLASELRSQFNWTNAQYGLANLLIATPSCSLRLTTTTAPHGWLTRCVSMTSRRCVCRKS